MSDSLRRPSRTTVEGSDMTCGLVVLSGKTAGNTWNSSVVLQIDGEGTIRVTRF